MTDNQEDQTETSGGEIFFWILWVLAFVIFPLYGFTFLFEINVMKSDDIGSQIAPIIGAAVFIAQIAVMVISFKQMKKKLPLSKPYLTLLGGTIIIGFIWVGGCVIMGPFHF
ncbi:MAG: hypothetical protein L3J51_09370 [Cocleimonas sp.]|nr:hypothetical protein [Cocleimonas sp.]